MTRLVPIVALVEDDVAARLEGIVAHRMLQADDSEALNALAKVMAANGWEPAMLVAGSLLRQAIEWVPEVSETDSALQ